METQNDLDLPPDFPSEIKIKFLYESNYGENPQERGFVAEWVVEEGKSYKVLPITKAKQLNEKAGKMSFTNWLDFDGVLKMLWQFEKDPFSTVFKHVNPSGACENEDLYTTAIESWNGDPLSAFGGIWGFNRSITKEIAEYMTDKKFFVAAIAPKYEDDALEILCQRENLRILEIDTRMPEDTGWDIRPIFGGFLLQKFDYREMKPEDLIFLEDRGIKRPTEEQIEDMLFGWKINRRTKSNTVLLVKDKKTVGIGAGQQNRVDAGFIACYRANKPYKNLKKDDREIFNIDTILDNEKTLEIKNYIHNKELLEHYETIVNTLRDVSSLYTIAQIAGLKAEGKAKDSTAVSSAFYPFPDTVNLLHAFKVKASLSPGGSIRDKLSYEALKKNNMAAAHTPYVEKGGYKGGWRGFLH